MDASILCPMADLRMYGRAGGRGVATPVTKVGVRVSPCPVSLGFLAWFSNKHMRIMKSWSVLAAEDARPPEFRRKAPESRARRAGEPLLVDINAEIFPFSAGGERFSSKSFTR
jgi:hypothetical protein